MNVQLNGDQSDTKEGAITLKANADLTGKENRLVKIINASGVAQFSLPAAVSDLALFVLMSGDVAANDNWGECPFSKENFRAKLHGTCNPGDTLILSDPVASSGVNAGAVEALAAQSAGTYFSPGVAEEAGVDGQNVKIRTHARIIRVKTALTSSQNSTAAAVDLPTTEALANALKASYNQLQTDVANLFAVV